MTNNCCNIVVEISHHTHYIWGERQDLRSIVRHIVERRLYTHCLSRPPHIERLCHQCCLDKLKSSSVWRVHTRQRSSRDGCTYLWTIQEKQSFSSFLSSTSTSHNLWKAYTEESELSWGNCSRAKGGAISHFLLWNPNHRARSEIKTETYLPRYNN